MWHIKLIGKTKNAQNIDKHLKYLKIKTLHFLYIKFVVSVCVKIYWAQVIDDYLDYFVRLWLHFEWQKLTTQDEP